MTPIDHTLAPHKGEIDERFVRASGSAGRTSTRSPLRLNCASMSARRRVPHMSNLAWPLLRAAA